MDRNEIRRAMVVEDDAATRAVVARHLERSGLEVVAVGSAEQAEAQAERAEAGFDLVITDVHLPRRSGLDLASDLLAKRPTQPIVLMTSDPDRGLEREALSRGPVTFLLKPFEMFALEIAVKQALLHARKPRPVEAVEAEAEGRVPQSWLDRVDRTSYAGSGHARRVGRISLALVERTESLADGLKVDDLLLAAWSHELGRLSVESADPVAIAGEGARMLEELECAPAVVEGVRHIHERYDGTGGPAQLAGGKIPAASQILAVADALDHFAAAWLQTGADASDAVERGLGLLRLQRGTVFGPDVVTAAEQQRGRLIDICGEPRPGFVTGEAAEG